MLCMPITCKRRDETTDEGADCEDTFTSLVSKARWFVLTQTEGEVLQPKVIPDWEAKRALAALALLVEQRGLEPLASALRMEEIAHCSF